MVPARPGRPRRSVAVYSLGYFAHGEPGAHGLRRRRRSTCCSARSRWCSSPTTSIAFLFAWEVMTLATAALVATEHETREPGAPRSSTWRMSHVGDRLPDRRASCARLARRVSGVRHAARSGRRRTGPMPRRAVRALLPRLRREGRASSRCTCGCPRRTRRRRASISALMSGVLIKTGIYGLVRVCAFGLGAPPLSWGVPRPRGSAPSRRCSACCTR